MDGKIYGTKNCNQYTTGEYLERLRADEAKRALTKPQSPTDAAANKKP